MELSVDFVKSGVMVIDLHDVSKRYSDEWVLRQITYTFRKGVIYGIEGSNGSGKSTLLKMISGHLSPSLGSIIYKTSEGKEIKRDDIYRNVSMWGPHTGLLEHLTIEEMVEHHFNFKKMGCNSVDQLYAEMNLPVPKKRLISSLSSGQTQRLALTLTIVSQSEILILDEPGSYLDENSVIWMNDLIKKYTKDRIVIIASNEPRDLILAKEKMDVLKYGSV